MKIREAVKKDVDQIFPIFFELVESEEKNLTKVVNFFNELIKRKDTLEKNSKKELLKYINGKDSILLVAEDKGKVTGYVSGKIVDSKNPFYKSINLGYLNHVIVSKKYRKKGVADELYKKCESFLKRKGCKYIYLEVFSNNNAVKKFNRWGYKITTHKMWKKIK